jgi:hypothetical protein
MNTKNKEQVLTMTVRETLKAIMQKEVEKLPEHLESLDTKERLNILCKLMPFVFPKVENIHSTDGEPLQW